MHSTFISLKCSIPEEFQDLFIGYISNMNFSGIEQSHDTMSILFEDIHYSQDIPSRLTELAETMSIPFEIISNDSIQHKNWNKEWEDSLEPVIVNDDIAITPEWKLHEVDKPITIIINPQMAFGTGYHPTTRMVCRELQRYVQSNSTWIDAGCGSGVLAILASKLGAQKVSAFDNDEWSVTNARENALLNNESDIDVFQADIFTVELDTADGIAANMYRNLIIPNLHKFYTSLSKNNGILIVSGILAMDAEEIRNEAINKRFTHIETQQEGDWVAIIFRADA